MDDSTALAAMLRTDGAFTRIPDAAGARWRRGVVAIVAALAGLSVAGCGDEGACEHVVCPIDEASCIERVAEVVGCRLEQETLAPTVRSLTAAEVVAEREAAATPLTAEEARVLDDYLRMQSLVGLMPEGYVAAMLEADSVRNAAAFYSPETKDITLISDRIAGNPEDDYLILVHEMVHAYQDAAWDLSAQHDEHARTHDRFLGLRAFIEGHAVLHANLASLELSDVDPGRIDWDTYFSEWQAESWKRAYDSEAPALDSLAHFVYAFGGEFALRAWQVGGDAQLDELSRRPPDSVRQVMQGFDFWPDRFVNEDASFDPRAVAVMPANYTLLTGGHEGIWSINAMLQRTAEGGLWAWTLENVSADYLAAWRWNDGDVVAMSRIRSARADSLLAALQTFGTRWQVSDGSDLPTTHLATKIESDVLLIAVSSGDARTVLADIEGWRSPSDAFPTEEAAASRHEGRLDPRRRGHGSMNAHDRPLTAVP